MTDKFKPGKSISLRWAQLVFGAAILIATVLIWMGITGVHWPTWLLALTAVL